jgi:hypothetical protein
LVLGPLSSFRQQIFYILHYPGRLEKTEVVDFADAASWIDEEDP